MKLIFAPDSFKGSLSALESCDILERMAARHFPGAQMISVPVADGGEGTVDALLRAMGGRRLYTQVTGPLFEPVTAEWGMLEDGMAHYAQAAERALGREIASFPGAGAAGGLGAALGGVLGATLKSGIDAVLDAADFDAKLEHADLVVTGEGRLDAQSVRFGKVPIGVARRCAARGIPVAAIVGGIGAGAEGLYDLCQATIQTIVPGPMSLDEAMQHAPALYAQAADRLFRAIRLGMRLGPL